MIKKQYNRHEQEWRLELFDKYEKFGFAQLKRDSENPNQWIECKKELPPWAALARLEDIARTQIETECNYRYSASYTDCDEIKYSHVIEINLERPSGPISNIFKLKEGENIWQMRMRAYEWFKAVREVVCYE